MVIVRNINKCDYSLYIFVDLLFSFWSTLFCEEILAHPATVVGGSAC